jgi:Protein kinase domain
VVLDAHPEGTLLRHATSTRNTSDSAEEADPILVAAARNRMVALLGVFCVAYAVSFGVEQAMRTGWGSRVFSNLMLTQNLGAAVVTGAAAVFLWKSSCSARFATRLSYVMVALIGLNETSQALRLLEWPSLWPSMEAVASGLHPYSLVSALPWTWLVIVLFPPFLPGRPRDHFLLMLVLATPMLAIPSAWAFFGPVSFWSVVSPVTLSNLPVCIALGVAISISIHRVNRALQRERRRSRELGSYELVRELGRGGMGEVWLARHKMLARPAALKLIKFDRVHGSTARAAEVMRRFEREAQATALLSSVHTVELYDFGRTDGGDFYYVMELLDGLDLDALVERHGPQEPARVVHILRQVCLSLDEAHARGIIHRDIKPANIFLCRQGFELDVVKVLDFGLAAWATKVDGREETRVTRDEELLGTPAFMAPEMVVAKHRVDHRTDLYALGCVAYWLLTGRLLFEHETPMEMAVAHVHTPLASPLFSESMAPVPAALESVIRSVLSKAPDDRPQSARELLTLLGEVEVSEGWTEEKQVRWWSEIPSADAR